MCLLLEKAIEAIARVTKLMTITIYGAQGIFGAIGLRVKCVMIF